MGSLVLKKVQNFRVLELSIQKSKAFQGENLASNIRTVQVKTCLIYLKIKNFRVVSGFRVVMRTVLLPLKESYVGPFKDFFSFNMYIAPIISIMTL